MTPFDILTKCTEFEWDSHNTDKIWLKHHVSPSECEQIFFNLPLVVADDVKHSEQENRFFALGQTDAGRFLFIVFTVRKNKIRVISARNMNRKERRAYQSHEKENPQV
ncbi:MAG: BrnT family toxin [Nitrospirota bacterium]